MTRITPTERAAIVAELDHLAAEVERLAAERTRLQALLDASPVLGDGTVRMLRPLCPCGLPRDHRHPAAGDPRPCADETARIALGESRRPPVPAAPREDLGRC